MQREPVFVQRHVAGGCSGSYTAPASLFKWRLVTSVRQDVIQESHLCKTVADMNQLSIGE